MILYKQFSVDGDDFVYDTAANAIVQLPTGAGGGWTSWWRRGPSLFSIETLRAWPRPPS